MKFILKKMIFFLLLLILVCNTTKSLAQETEPLLEVPALNLEEHANNPPKPVTFPRNTLFFTRKKEGNGHLIVSAKRDSFVKLVDWDTKRLEAYFWVRQGTSFIHEFIPDARYMVYFAQDVYETHEGELLGTWFGKTSEPFFIGNFRRTNMDLSIVSQTHRFLKSDSVEFTRFSPPK